MLKHIFSVILFWIASAPCIAIEKEEYVPGTHFIFSWVDKQSVIIQTLLTEKSWYYSFKTGDLVVLPRDANSSMASPSGQYLLSVDWSPDKLSLVNLHDTDPANHIQVFARPVVKYKDSSELKGHRERAFWISDKRIYVEYYNVSSGRYSCHIFNTPNEHWESVSARHCFNFLQYPVGASRVKYLGKDLYAISSSAGGEVTFRVIKWTYENGNGEIKLPEFWIGAGSNMSFYYEEQDSSIYVLSTTPLDPDNTPVDYTSNYSEGDRILYRWIQNKHFFKTDVKLKNHISLYSALNKKTAWISNNGNEICTGVLERKQSCNKINLK